MKIPKPPPDDLVPAFCHWILGFIVVLCAIRNIPWHLDDYDQAKQAFTSFEILQGGDWLYQHTPTGNIATKPPLAGWLSAALYLMWGAHGWELAWRLPSFACALLLLWTLWRTGTHLYGNNIGGMLAAGMFGLNFFTPRLATLVRTDMLLATFIFFAGWLVLEKLRSGEPWMRRDQWMLFGFVLGALLTKGPIAYGFLAPGLLAFWWLTRQDDRATAAVMAAALAEAEAQAQATGGGGARVQRIAPAATVWAGWWCWVGPLAVFVAWVAYGIAVQPGFKEQVIYREFLGRFTMGEGAVHNNQWPGFYTLNLLTKALPWTALLAAFFLVPSVRAALRKDRELLWLACWTLGGLAFMECVPSKRFDRIFPAVAPACLLLTAAARHLPKFEWRGQPLARVAILSVFVALPLAAGYTGWKVFHAVDNDARHLVRFGQKVAGIVGDQRDRLAVVNGKDEGMLLYIKQPRFHSLDDALRMWRFNRVDWLVMGYDDFSEVQGRLAPFEVLVQSPQLPGKANAYRFVKRMPRTLRVDPVPGPAREQATAPQIAPLIPGGPAWEPPTRIR